jgi:hypothetical protein
LFPLSSDVFDGRRGAAGESVSVFDVGCCVYFMDYSREDKSVFSGSCQKNGAGILFFAEKTLAIAR